MKGARAMADSGRRLKSGGGISNTVTSVLKDFYVFVVYEKNNRT